MTKQNPNPNENLFGLDEQDFENWNDKGFFDEQYQRQ